MLTMTDDPVESTEEQAAREFDEELARAEAGDWEFEAVTTEEFLATS